ncbi:tetratricopeptide repeat protein [Phenylobacterium sp.]|uniref:tetratricopeptide repeat protein n=1 Tax=Phenylobacterium sp. TaxID=1871053 RepID=UPI00301D980D
MPPPLSAADVRQRAAKLERAGDLEGALETYQAALALAPDDAGLLAAVAALAGRLGMPEIAARLWGRVAVLDPSRLDAVDGRAVALRELGRFDEAVEILRGAITAHPADARLWNTLGVTLVQQGQPETALTFFDEAVRLDPRSATALYNRGGAKFDLGDLPGAGADFAQARKVARKPADAAMIVFAQATLRLAAGELGEGWDDYEARFAHDLAGAPVFEAPGRRWRPADRLDGQKFLVVAEQGVGDEAMFAGVLPDLAAALGPEGELHMAVEPRLVPLFARSFPTAHVTAHATRTAAGRRRRSAPEVPREIQLWAPMASLMRRFRRGPDDFPQTSGYLRPEPARVAHWRGWLGAGPPAVGITWRSGKVLGDRRRYYPPTSDWIPLLKTPGVRFVNIQYGDCAEELAAFRAATGAAILEPPGLDLRDDLDDLAALTVALDQVVAVANATAALAGASGAALALLAPPHIWTDLGADAATGRCLWYPQARRLTPSAPGDWSVPMAQAAALAAERAVGR